MDKGAWLGHKESKRQTCQSAQRHKRGLTAMFSGCMRASLIAQLVKNLPAMQETWVQFLGWEDPLEKEMATHSSILAWRIPWTEEPGRLLSMGSQESDTT